MLCSEEINLILESLPFELVLEFLRGVKLAIFPLLNCFGAQLGW